MNREKVSIFGSERNTKAANKAPQCLNHGLAESKSPTNSFFSFFFRPNHPPTILISLTKTATQKASWASLKVNIQILHAEDMFEPNMFFERKWKTLGISHHISPLSTMRCFCLGAIWTKNHLHVIQIHPLPSLAISGGTGTMRNHEEPSGNVQKTSRWVESG